MQKKNWLFLVFIAAAITTILVAGRSENDSSGPSKNNRLCSKTRKQECVKREKDNAPANMILEGLSRQFIVISPLPY